MLPRGIWSSRARGSHPSCSCKLCCSATSLDSLTHCTGQEIKPMSWHCRDAADTAAPIGPQWELLLRLFNIWYFTGISSMWTWDYWLPLLFTWGVCVCVCVCVCVLVKSVTPSLYISHYSWRFISLCLAFECLTAKCLSWSLVWHWFGSLPFSLSPTPTEAVLFRGLRFEADRLFFRALSLTLEERLCVALSGWVVYTGAPCPASAEHPDISNHLLSLWYSGFLPGSFPLQAVSMSHMRSTWLQRQRFFSSFLLTFWM